MRDIVDRLLRNRYLRDERGSISPATIFFAFLIAVGFTGVVVDTAGANAAQQQASFTASSAARAGTAALSGDITTASSGALDNVQAANAAEQYLAAAGADGYALVRGDTITVTVVENHPTALLAIFGIPSIAVQGSSSAQLISEGP